MVSDSVTCKTPVSHSVPFPGGEFGPTFAHPPQWQNKLRRIPSLVYRSCSLLTIDDIVRACTLFQHSNCPTFAQRQTAQA